MLVTDGETSSLRGCVTSDVWLCLVDDARERGGDWGNPARLWHFMIGGD
ncbi:MAG: hypothetical protein O3A00_26855 [Planctomycetota bacterium]|nr:hypothetical protein [Planctomycetota bacterium]